MRRFQAWVAVEATIIAVAYSFAPANADEVEHIGYQNSCMVQRPDFGSFFDPDIWYGFMPPDPDSTVLFGSGFDPDEDGLNPHILHFGDFCANVPDCPEPRTFEAREAHVENVWLFTGDWTFDFGPGQVGDCEPPGQRYGSLFIDHELIIASGRDTDAALTLQYGTTRAARVGIGTDEGLGFLTLYQAVLETDNIHIGQGNTPFYAEMTLLGNETRLQENTHEDSQIGGGWGENSATLTVLNGATARFGGNLFVCRGQGVGRLQVATQGTVHVEDGDLFIGGEGVGAFGTVFLDGPGTRIDVNGNCIAGWIGSGATGALFIQNAAVMTSVGGELGSQPTSLGLADLTGAGSSWNIAVNLIAGREGEAHINLSGGAVLSAQSAILGLATSAAAMIQIDHAGSSMDVSERLVIALEGQSIVSVTAGAGVSATDVILGEHPTGNGLLNVNGADATARITGTLVAGMGGQGTIDIGPGASVFCDMGVVATEPGSIGQVTLRGGDASWDAMRDLYLGGAGEAHIVAAGNSRVVASHIVIAAESTGRALVEVSGSEAFLGGLSVVGLHGRGTLLLTRGADASSADAQSGKARHAFIGERDGAVGAVTVSDGGSRWTGIDHLTIGGVYHTVTNGTGFLTIRRGGVVESVWGVLGEGNSRGEARIEGAGASWSMIGPLLVGTGGVGVVSVSSGGRIECDSAELGIGPESSGTLTIDSPKSVARVTNDLHVGGDGEGFLKLLNSGEIEAATVRIAAKGSLEGHGAVYGEVVNEGQTAPGAPIGRLDVIGRWQQVANGRLSMELSGTTQTALYDVLHVQGTAELSGTLNVSLRDGFMPAQGDQFNVLTCYERIGEFTFLELPDLTDLRMEVRYDDASVTLLTVANIDCGRISRFSGRCTNGKLRALVRSELPAGTTLLVDKNGDRRIMTLNDRGRGKVVYKNQSGVHTVRLEECPEQTVSIECQ